MRVSFPDGAATILTYCTNVHAIERLDDARTALARFCGPVREALGESRLALGLWLSRRAATELLASEHAMSAFAAEMEAHALDVVTLNGFPFGDFHAERVKEDVYRPDWSLPERCRYTLDLARIMCRLMPDDVVEGTISTLPLTWGPTRSATCLEDGADLLVQAAGELERLVGQTGRSIRVCLEPEPGCVVETTDQAIAFFEQHLRPLGKRRGLTNAVERHLGLCFDACHQAVVFEDARASWRRLVDGGVPVGKVQLSCALELPSDAPSGKDELLAPFDEPRFLHQVRARERGSERVSGQEDIGAALHGPGALPRAADWRVHFHVPLHWRPQAGGLRTTRDELVALIGAVVETRPLPHLEVETYTWGVLPAEIRPRDDATLVEGIVAEIEFARAALSAAVAARSV